MPLLNGTFHQARITYRRDVAPDLWIIRIAAGGEFKFVPGQYATLGIHSQDLRIERPYSIVSSPYEPELEFFLELVSDGELTPHLHKLQPGSELTLRKTAKGRFAFHLQSGRSNHPLMCTVTGVAPYLSFVRTLLADWKENRFLAGVRVFLIQGASRSWEFGYREELESAAARAPWLKYVPTVSRFWEDATWTGERGRVEDIVRKYTDLWKLTSADTTAHLCGHPLMAKNGMAILQRAGFAKDSIKQELYWVPKLG